ncbi:hypothetical protein [Streptomyces sp. H27-S2]|uniref:hypothetical protein n=1 Tax=Streptomyces antarcticus TaxID=2996458 RepID=UPI00226DC252|nr:hypothetical protein [Streptomyces sp. H27-S2]MCY0953742.1 hypothetical protein [Streptomyces sp. H27-S2]
MEHEQTIPELRKADESAPEPDGSDPTAAPAAGTSPAAADAATADAATADGAAAAAAPRRRRGRTTPLIAAAAVLGVLAGTVAGYAVQYHRAPTPLPPLAQQNLVTPKAVAPDDSTTIKTINANRWHKNDDDLGKLLIEAPDGTKSEGKGYDSLDVFAADFEKPDLAVSEFASEGLRRVASTHWSRADRVFVQVQLVQFTDYAGAENYQKNQASFMPLKENAGYAGVAIPGISWDLGRVWVDSKAREQPGYEPTRGATAIARRGDIVMTIYYYDNRGGKIAESDIIRLAERQLERL